MRHFWFPIFPIRWFIGVKWKLIISTIRLRETKKIRLVWNLISLKLFVQIWCTWCRLIADHLFYQLYKFQIFQLKSFDEMNERVQALFQRQELCDPLGLKFDIKSTENRSHTKLTIKINWKVLISKIAISFRYSERNGPEERFKLRRLRMNEPLMT